MHLADFIAQMLAGLNSAAIYFIAASGLTMVFGVLHILNFAHGGFFLVAAYACASLAKTFGGGSMALLVGLVVAPIAVALLGAIVEVVLLRRVYLSHILFQFLLMFGMVYVLDDIMKLIWGTLPVYMPRPPALDGSISVMGRELPVYSIFTISISFLVGLFLWLLLRRTVFGKRVRAIFDNEEMARALGINVPQIRTMVFMLGCWLAGIAGGVAAGGQALMPGSGTDIVILAFIVVVIGGAGSIAGAAIGALLIGELTAFGIIVLPMMEFVFVYILLCIILLLRPWGLLGKRLLQH